MGWEMLQQKFHNRVGVGIIGINGSDKSQSATLWKTLYYGL
jgi:hypothetical protein